MIKSLSKFYLPNWRQEGTFDCSLFTVVGLYLLEALELLSDFLQAGVFLGQIWENILDIIRTFRDHKVGQS
jgi:hypothetical protein